MWLLLLLFTAVVTARMWGKSKKMMTSQLIFVDNRNTWQRKKHNKGSGAEHIKCVCMPQCSVGGVVVNQIGGLSLLVMFVYNKINKSHK